MTVAGAGKVKNKDKEGFAMIKKLAFFLVFLNRFMMS